MLTSYATYNAWANTELFKVIVKLSEEQQYAEVKSSFPSLYKTITHIWDAESGWWQRLKLEEHIKYESEQCTNMADAINAIQNLDILWLQWITNATEMQLRHVFAYQNSKKQQFKQPVWEMLLHVFNHSAYHRGQIVTILRQLDIYKIPQTDYIVWSRGK